MGKGIAHIPDALGAGFAQLFFEHFAVLGFFVHAVHAHFQAAQGFLERLLEGAAHGHHLAHRFHLGGQSAVSGREFFKRKTRNLGDHIVNAGLEARRRGTPGDVVAQLVQGVAHGQFGGHLGNGETRGFGGQRGRTRHARVHLDHDHAPIHGVDRELHVGAAGVHPDFTQHRQRCVAHDLVLLVGQRLRRGHGDGVARVHAHGVEVFDGADDDAVVRLVAHHFHLKLFPPDQGFFNQQFVGGRSFQAALADRLELFRVVGNTAARAAQREAGSNHHGKADSLLYRPGLVQAVGDARARRAQPNAGHGFLEFLAVLGLVDGLGRGTDQFHLVLVEHTLVP